KARSEAGRTALDRHLAHLAQRKFDRLEILAVIAIDRGHPLRGATFLRERVRLELAQDLHLFGVVELFVLQDRDDPAFDVGHGKSLPLSLPRGWRRAGKRFPCW